MLGAPSSPSTKATLPQTDCTCHRQEKSLKKCNLKSLVYERYRAKTVALARFTLSIYLGFSRLWMLFYREFGKTLHSIFLQRREAGKNALGIFEHM